MFVFKILLIILIALPVIALAWFFFFQMLGYIKEKNTLEDEMIRRSVLEEGVPKRRKGKRAKKAKKAKVKESDK